MSSARSRETGITLFEILVVLTVLSIASGAAVLAFARSDAVLVEAEARRLADRLQLAADEALVTATALALTWDARSYRFLAWDTARAEWQPPVQRLLAWEHALPRRVALDAGTGNENALVIPPDLTGSEAAFRLSDGRVAWRILFDGVTAAVEPLEG